MFELLDEHKTGPVQPDVSAIRRRARHLRVMRQMAVGVAVVVCAGLLVAGLSLRSQARTVSTTATIANGAPILQDKGALGMDAQVTCEASGSYSISGTITNNGPRHARVRINAANLLVTGAGTAVFRFDSGLEHGILTDGQSMRATLIVPGSTRARVGFVIAIDGSTLHAQQQVLAGDCLPH